MIIKKKRFANIPKPVPQKEIEAASVMPAQPPETAGIVQEKTIIEEKQQEVENEDIFEGFDFQNIDFSQRSERRRGDRRRGYRRVDDRNLISRAQEEAILIKEESTKEGYEEGLARAQHEINELAEALTEFFDYKVHVYDKVSNDILDISLEVAKKIIKREVAADKTILEDIIYDALENIAKDENKIILKVAPVDVEYVKELVPELLSTGAVEAKIYVTAEKTVDEGGVIIETSNGLIDANITTQINILKEAFKQI